MFRRAVDRLSGGDGVEVDWVLKMTCQLKYRWEGRGWSNITPFESWEAVCSQKIVQNRFKCAWFLTVFAGINMLITASETLFFSKIGID